VSVGAKVTLDPLQLLAFAISPFAVPAYNLPILLFGTFAQETSDAVQSLKLVCLLSSRPHVRSTLTIG